jgi:hypothetical protein
MIIPIPIFLLALLVYLCTRSRSYDTAPSQSPEGCLPTLTRCEKCGVEYVYFISGITEDFGADDITAFGRYVASSQHTAGSDRVERLVRKACAIVPCPACGLIQANMVRQSRKARRRWMIKLTYILAAAGVIFWLGTRLTASRSEDNVSGASLESLIFSVGFYAVIAVLIIVPLLRFWLNRRYDPNSQRAEERLTLGQSKALTKIDFIVRMEARARKLEGWRNNSN